MRFCRTFKSAIQNFIFVHNGHKWPTELLSSVTTGCTVKPDFITEAEEQALFREIEPHMKRLKYERDHWDNAIYLYREREHSRWTDENKIIVQRIRDASFPKNAHHLSYIHILDLNKDGHIKPHIDAVRYCGTTISGVSLLSEAVMRLRHKDEKDLIVDLYLPRRSLYKLSGVGRYTFTHEVLSSEESFFQGQKVEKGRRISVICRDIPQAGDTHPEIDFKKLE